MKNEKGPKKTSSGRKGNAGRRSSRGKRGSQGKSTPKAPSAPSVDPIVEYEKPYAQWSLLSDGIKEALAGMGYVNATPVQRAAIEPAIYGRNLVVQAQTGTGKTAGFGIPLVERINVGQKRPQAMVLAPTRELAGQVATELSALGEHKGVRVAAIYGGVRIKQQIQELKKGVDIIVGTPGRILDHIRRRSLDPRDVLSLVLDEADEMLSMGFYMEVARIIDACARREQVMLFSATIPPDIEGLVRQYLEKPMRLMVSGGSRKVDGIEHILYSADNDLPRPRNLLYIIESRSIETAIVFCNRRSETVLVANYLNRQGKSASALSGELEQDEREQVLQRFKDGEIQFLIATDVAARGIDVAGLSFVLNYNFPSSSELYIHRSGRTGRRGSSGVSISLFSGPDVNTTIQLKREHQIPFRVFRLPPSTEIVKVAAEKHIKALFEVATKEIVDPYLPLANVMAEQKQGRFVFAYLLKLFHEGRLNVTQQSSSPQPSNEAAPANGTAPSNGEQESSKESNGESAETAQLNPQGPVRLYMKNAGFAEGFDPESVRQLVFDTAEVQASELGGIQLEKHHAFLDANNDAAQKILEAFQGDENGVMVEVAKKQPRHRRHRS